MPIKELPSISLDRQNSLITNKEDLASRRRFIQVLLAAGTAAVIPLLDIYAAAGQVTEPQTSEDSDFLSPAAADNPRRRVENAGGLTGMWDHDNLGSAEYRVDSDAGTVTMRMGTGDRPDIWRAAVEPTQRFSKASAIVSEI